MYVHLGLVSGWFRFRGVQFRGVQFRGVRFRVWFRVYLGLV